MKKSTFVLALLMVFGSVAMAQHQSHPQRVLKNVEKQLKDQRWTEIYRPNTIVLVREEGTYRYVFTYDEDYYLTTLETQVNNEFGGWVTHNTQSYEYDFNGNVTEILQVDDFSGENLTLETHTYDGDVLTTILYQNWDDGDWVNSEKEEYSFDGNTTVILDWMWTGTTWAMDYLYTYTYGDTSTELLIQYMQGGAWQNDEKQTSTYNEDGLLLSVLYEVWDEPVWENAWKMVYDNTDGLYDMVHEYEWDGVWVEAERSKYEYDSKGNAIAGAHECYEDGAWSDCQGDLEMYYGHNEEVYYFGGLSFDATYVDVTSVDEETVDDSFTFYPNPVKDVLMVRADDFQMAEVYSLTGAKLMETTSNRVNVSELQSGMYLLKVYGKETGCQARVFVVK